MRMPTGSTGALGRNGTETADWRGRNAPDTRRIPRQAPEDGCLWDANAGRNENEWPRMKASGSDA